MNADFWDFWDKNPRKSCKILKIRVPFSFVVVGPRPVKSPLENQRITQMVQIFYLRNLCNLWMINDGLCRVVCRDIVCGIPDYAASDPIGAWKHTTSICVCLPDNKRPPPPG
jgi:hypothetical protein